MLPECCYHHKTAICQSVWWIVCFNRTGIFWSRNSAHGSCGAGDRSVAHSSSGPNSSFTSHWCIISSVLFVKMNCDIWTGIVFVSVHTSYWRESPFQTYIPNQNSKATIPSIAAMEHAPNVHAMRRLMLTSAYEGDMFRSLASVVSYVHLLWELVLLSEPIVVMAGSPTTCSEMVQALIA